MNKRTFLKACTFLGASAPWFSYAKTQTAKSLASDEEFWEGIRGGYKLSPDFINLESGYYNITPEATLEKYFRHIRKVNAQGAYYMRTVQFENKKRITPIIVGNAKKNYRDKENMILLPFDSSLSLRL
jgi:hypothetical protein